MFDVAGAGLVAGAVYVVVGAVVVGAAEGVAAGAVVVAVADGAAVAGAVGVTDADGVGAPVVVRTLGVRWLRWLSVSWRAASATPPAPAVASAARPAVIAVTWR